MKYRKSKPVEHRNTGCQRINEFYHLKLKVSLKYQNFVLIISGMLLFLGPILWDVTVVRMIHFFHAESNKGF